MTGSETPQKYLREPLGFESNLIAQDVRRRTIRIHHPAYPPKATLLLGFPGLDSSSGEIDFNLVHTACAIVADNRFDGFLSRQDSHDALSLTGVTTLEPGDYYFHVPPPRTGDNDPEEPLMSEHHDSQRPYLYPIVANFRYWEFPSADTWNRHLQRLWSSSVLGLSRSNNSACVLTGHTNATEEAHIVPAGEGQWFLNNDMGDYVSRKPSGDANSLIDDRANIITLRADMHRLWDNKSLTFVPKQCGDSLCMYVHSFDFDEQLVELYHNRPLAGLSEASPECFFARFALSLFPLARFLSVDTCKRLLRIRTESGAVEDKECTAKEAAAQYMNVSRSTSPRKRKQAERSQSAAGNVQYQTRYYFTQRGCKRIRRQSSSYTDSGFASDYMTEGSFEEELRGRPRKRRCDIADLRGLEHRAES